MGKKESSTKEGLKPDVLTIKSAYIGHIVNFNGNDCIRRHFANGITNNTEWLKVGDPEDIPMPIEESEIAEKLFLEQILPINDK